MSIIPATPAGSVIASIPVAKDGDVIDKIFHNSLRDAVISLLSAGTIGQGPLPALSPAFLPKAKNTPWTLAPGIASFDATAAISSATGWLPVELPQGGVIESLMVTGARTGTIVSFPIVLLRQPLSAQADPAQVLMKLQCANAPATFLLTADANALADDLRQVDNTKFKYFLTADVGGADPGANAQITSIQIALQRLS